jgi:hypothetical protein
MYNVTPDRYEISHVNDHLDYPLVYTLPKTVKTPVVSIETQAKSTPRPNSNNIFLREIMDCVDQSFVIRKIPVSILVRGSKFTSVLSPADTRVGWFKIQIPAMVDETELKDKLGLQFIFVVGKPGRKETIQEEGEVVFVHNVLFTKNKQIISMDLTKIHSKVRPMSVDTNGVAVSEIVKVRFVKGAERVPCHGHPVMSFIMDVYSFEVQDTEDIAMQTSFVLDPLKMVSTENCVGSVCNSYIVDAIMPIPRIVAGGIVLGDPTVSSPMQSPRVGDETAWSEES